MNVLHLLLLLFILASVESYAIDFISPKQSEDLVAGKVYSLEWEPVTGATYSLYYSEDEGSTLVPIVTNLPQNNYIWTIPELNSSKIDLYCEAYVFYPPELITEKDLETGRIISISYDKSFNRLIVSTASNQLFVLDTDLQNIDEYLISDVGNMFDSDFVREDSLLFTAGDRLYIYDMNDDTYDEFASGAFQLGFNIQQAVFNEERNEIVAASYDGSVRVFDLVTGNEKISFVSDDNLQFYSLSYSDDSRYLAAGDRAGRVYIYDLENNSQKKIPPKSSNVVWNVARAIDINHNNQRIVVAYIDGSFAEYNMSDLSVISSMNFHTGQLRAAEYLPNEDIFMLASMDKTFTHWEDAGQVHEAADTKITLSDACYSESGDTIALASFEGKVQLWKNFVRDRDTAETSFNLKYEIKVALGDYKAKLNERLEIAPQIEYNYTNKAPLEAVERFEIDFDFPAKSLWPVQDIDEDRRGSRFFFSEIFSADNIPSAIYVVLYNSDERKASLKIDEVIVDNDMLLVTSEDGSIEIADECLYDFSDSKILGKAEIVISPLPASEVITVNCKLPESHTHSYRIYSASGSLVANMGGEINYETSNKKINISNLSNGLYTFEIISKSGQKYSRKILIQK